VKARKRVVLPFTILLTGVLAACGSGSSSEPTSNSIEKTETLSVMTWGGTWTAAEKAAYEDPFTAETKIPVRFVTPMTTTKFQVAVETGKYDVDVALLPPYNFAVLKHKGMLEPIDYSKIDLTGLPESVSADKYGVQGSLVAQMLVYRSDVFPQGGPQSWADFWDVKKFPGPRSLENNPTGNIERALLADGVPPDQVYPLTADKLDRAFASLDRIKPHIKKWWASDQVALSQQMIRDKEVVMTMAFSGRVTPLIAEGVPLTMVWNQASPNIGLWAIPKGDPNADAAHKLISVAMGAENQAKFAKGIGSGYGFLNPAAAKLFSEDELKTMPSSHFDTAFYIDNDWWGQNLSKILPRWNQWMAK
jgi:putative spermidine/putrescine transport system substrate-binding protein